MKIESMKFCHVLLEICIIPVPQTEEHSDQSQYCPV